MRYDPGKHHQQHRIGQWRQQGGAPPAVGVALRGRALGQYGRRPGQAQAKFAGRPTPVAAAPAPAPAAAAAGKPRFGIGSLINRMAGHLEAGSPTAPAGRTQPPVTSYDDDHDMGSDQDRIEIPAFLRRQAN